MKTYTYDYEAVRFDAPPLLMRRIKDRARREGKTVAQLARAYVQRGLAT